MKKLTLFAISLFVLSGAVAHTSSAAEKPEDAIKIRQAGYRFMSWNMSKLKRMLIEQPKTFDAKQAKAAAALIQATANSGMGALFKPGTGPDDVFVKTHAKPEAFMPEHKEELKKRAQSFNKEANKLAQVASTGDASKLKIQFSALGKACKACHKKFKEKD